VKDVYPPPESAPKKKFSIGKFFNGVISLKRYVALIIVAAVVFVFTISGTIIIKANSANIQSMQNKIDTAQAQNYSQAEAAREDGYSTGYKRGFSEGADSVEIVPPTTTTPDVPAAAEAGSEQGRNTPVSGEVELFQMEPFSSDYWTPDVGECQDSLGNRYNTDYISYLVSSKGDWWSEYRRDCWAEFRLDGKYTRLKGRYAPHLNLQDGETVNIIIYADNGNEGNYQVVYQSDALRRKTEPLPIDFDIDLGQDCKYMRVDCVRNANKESTEHNMLLLIDWRLYN
jgi:hypothetical protein